MNNSKTKARPKKSKGPRPLEASRSGLINSFTNYDLGFTIFFKLKLPCFMGRHISRRKKRTGIK
jgi:hypothetical protein